MQNWEVSFKPWLRHTPPSLTHPYQPKIKLCLLTPCQRYCLISANLQGYLHIAPPEIPLEQMHLFTPSGVGPSWCSETNTVFLKNISDRHEVCCNLLAALLSGLTTIHHYFFSRLLLWISTNLPSPPWLWPKQGSHTLCRKTSVLSLWKWLDAFSGSFITQGNHHLPFWPQRFLNPFEFNNCTAFLCQSIREK